MLKSHKKNILEILGRSPIHPFPARMAPGIALEALGDSETPLRVLDPMAGSGTVLAVARSKGHRAFGVDLDPLSVLLAGVWTRTVDVERVSDTAADVLGRSKAAFAAVPSRRAYPSGSDEETQKFIRYWFDDYARRQLAALSAAIHRVHDDATRDVLWCGFSRLIITKSAGASLAMDLSHSRPHREFTRAPAKPFNRFISAVKTVVSNCPQPGSGPLGPATVVKQGDARNLEAQDGSIDLVLTSPPYLNAIDYMRCSKFSLVWMGYNIAELRRLRSDSVGAELGDDAASNDAEIADIIADLKLRPTLGTRDKSMLARYISDMRQTVREVARVLVPGGKAVYVIGENTIRGTYVRNSAIVSAVADLARLTLRERRVRLLPANRRYLPPPARRDDPAALSARMRREVVLTFTKPSAS